MIEAVICDLDTIVGEIKLPLIAADPAGAERVVGPIIIRYARGPVLLSRWRLVKRDTSMPS